MTVAIAANDRMRNSIIWLVTACQAGHDGAGRKEFAYGMTASVRGQLGIAALITAAGTAGAAENLPPLRVDPALLGLSTPASKPRETASAAAGDSPTSSFGPAPGTVETVAPLQAANAEAASTNRKSTRGKPLVPAAAPAAAAVAKQQSVMPPSGNALKERPVEAPTVAAANAPTTSLTHQPPEVTEQPRIPPLYSAYERAGRLPGQAPVDTKNAPIYLVADRIDGRTEEEIVAEGKVDMVKANTTLNADKLTYWQVEDEVEAVGNVKLTRDFDVITGPKMRMQLDESTGYFEQPKYSIRREQKLKKANQTQSQFDDLIGLTQPKVRVTTGVGEAERIEFEGEGQYRFSKATYSTCPAGDNPDWVAEMGSLKLDYDSEVGTGQDTRVVFKGVPILYSPWMSFSLNNQRKSGLLPATFGTNTRTGAQYTQPIYWNIAPNMDATLTPRVMSKRGLQVLGELRYLDFNYTGTSRFEYLPKDSVTNSSRSAYSILHNQNFGYGFSGGVNLNGVSDDTYFTDLSTRISSISQGNLVRQGNIAYNGPWWSANLLAQRYQTLQDPTAPTTPPYARLPQLTLSALRPDLPYGVNFALNGEYVQFSHPTNVIGKRTVFYPQLSLPLQTSALFLTPKIGVHATTYSLERQAAGTPNQFTRQVPIFSVDSGVTFERDTQMFGKNLAQTLEPRLYYVYIPRREQSQIPVFDTALSDFNFAQIFTENRYGGQDRIGDANQLTAAVTSRLIQPETGVELVRAMVGQRYYFSNQYVTLPNETARVDRKADLIASLSGLVMPKTYLDTGWQYNPRDSRTERLNVGTRYQPEIGKVLNAGYRYTRNLLGQIDVSGQWPVSGGWSGVARYNYSTKEKRLVEGVAGFEYNAGCWAVRGVLQQIALTAQSKSTSLFIQLELSGFSNIGSNPSDILRRNIPGYGRTYDTTADPAFGGGT